MRQERTQLIHLNTNRFMKKFLNLIVIISLALTMSHCKQTQKPIQIVKGVSKEIAEYRKSSISDIEYDLQLKIPASIEEKIPAKEIITFKLSDISQDLILDFSVDSFQIQSVICNDNPNYQFKENHIIIPASSLKEGDNLVHILFNAGESSLNRNKEYLYTLFVPDRASTAFPCFDQPDLKAKFKLTLRIPEEWTAIANAPVLKTDITPKGKILFFDITEPLSTYLFSFVAGKFETITKNINGRSMQMLHRETDKKLLNKNIDEIFKIHADALDWLEEYTGIKYPFKKFDFALVPFFQYGGMEHPGAILYKASLLFLEDNATINQKLRRANLISHETAHMWFGDYVTMPWFDDVWMKEVFANFMADKMVNPGFPDINHELKFLLAHYPPSYKIDRTSGANPIQQELGNMKNAGTLYGSIIYHKAPIVFNHLEKIMGKEKLQLGVKEYLNSTPYGNAGWDDLISILDKHIDKDMHAWSKIWIKSPGMPHISLEKNKKSGPTDYTLIQEDPSGNDKIWPQILNPYEFYDTKIRKREINFNKKKHTEKNDSEDEPNLILINGEGLGYGYFKLDKASLNYLKHDLQKLKSSYHRGIAYLSLWENMLNKNLSPQDLFYIHTQNIQKEDNEQLVQLLLNQIQTNFWTFHNAKKRESMHKNLENLLWEKINLSYNKGLKRAYFNTYKNIALSKEALNNLEKLWNKETSIKGLSFSENDYTSMAYQLSLKLDDLKYLNEQLERIKNEDRKARMQFIIPAVSPDEKVRDHFFNRLKHLENRAQERWVITALKYLHHPLRAEYSVKYLQESLELLEEIQITGDIFFPMQWLTASFSGHQSAEANQIVNTFLKNNPDYPKSLKGKILQATDFLKRNN